MRADEEPGKTDWDQRAKHWAKAAPTSVSTHDAPNQLLIDRAGIGVGDHVLDLASGTGEPAISIALKVGDEGSVLATDASATMLEAAKSRAEKLNLRNISFQVCPMEELPFEADSFDAITCRFGLMQSDDAVATLAGARRVLKPGKRMAVMVHGAKEKNTQYSVVRAAVFAFLGAEDNATDIRRFRFSGPGELTELFEAAGFTGVEEEEISEIVTRPAGQNFWRSMVERTFGTKVVDLRADQRAALDDAIERAFEPYLEAGEYRLRSTERLAWGTA
jgi:ubiquinone/menaquinone biosynthesis C-methylase UbiE